MTAPSAGAARVASLMDRWVAVIGIEIHCQLRTASKMFCACSTAYDGAAPNTHVCPVCLGLPGTLPTINRRAVELVLATGLAIEATVPERTQWERKNYFYPDLPKGYQISQYAIPLAADGRLTVETSAGPFTVGIRRAHLEEDTAKLAHPDRYAGGRASLVDFNRSGAPLMEIVTEPDIRTAEQARRYAEELQLLMRAIGASDADMERGQMRVEANVSIRPRGSQAFGTRVEVKNMNSFRSVERAIGYEIERQAAALEAGESLSLETRGWDDGRQATYHMRSKETSEDYRYFPEPDLPPLHVEPAWLDAIRATLPELPAARRARYAALGITAYDAAVIVADPLMTAAFDAISAAAGDAVPAKEVSNFVTGAHAREAKAAGVNADGTAGRSTPAGIATLLAAVTSGRVGRPIGRDLLDRHMADGTPAAELLAGAGPGPISDDAELRGLVDAVIAANPRAVADYRAGKPVIGFFVGQVMKATSGAADAARVTILLRERLDGGGA